MVIDIKRFLCFLFVILLFLAVFRSLIGAPRLSFNHLLTVLHGIYLTVELPEFAACVADISNFYTNFSGSFPDFHADNIFDAIKSTALYVKTFMQMYYNQVVNLAKMSFIIAAFPIRATWAFIKAYFQLLGIQIGTLPDGYGSGWG